MIGFVMVGTNNLDKAINFYDTLLSKIELKRVVTNEKYAGYALKNKPEMSTFDNMLEFKSINQIL